MPSVHSYKKKENEVVDQLGRRAKTLGSGVGAFLRRVVLKGKQRFTVMFIPHSEKRIFNIQISVFTVLFVVLMGVLLVLAFIGFSTHFTATNRQITDMSLDLDENEALVQSYRDGISVVRRDAERIQAVIEQITSAIDPEDAGTMRAGVGGDLSQLIKLEQSEDPAARDLRDLRKISDFLRDAEGPLETIRQSLIREQEFLHQIPTLWPLVGGRGYVSARFGPAEHPFYEGQWYLHKGIDIVWKVGTEIVATADGEVQHVGDNPLQYGKNVIIRHQYGFSTRYGHMSGILVKNGQQIRRGQVIGYLGNTGLSSGPHLHYEVRIAGQVVDPDLYLDLSSRWGSGGSYADGVIDGR